MSRDVATPSTHGDLEVDAPSNYLNLNEVQLIGVVEAWPPHPLRRPRNLHGNKIVALIDGNVSHHSEKKCPGPVRMTDSLQILIADDHALFRKGFAMLLQDSLAQSKVIEASGFDSALDILAG